MKTGSVSGEQSILARVTGEDVRALAFSPNSLQITNETSDQGLVDASTRPDAVVFHLRTALKRGQRVQLHFTFEGKPARGLTLVPGGLVTSYFACDWMVCLQDAPGNKADFALDLYIPQGLRSLGVGRAKEVVRLSGGLEQHSWRSTRSYSAYLFAFAAGAFTHETLSTAQGKFVIFDSSTGRQDLAQRLEQTSSMAAFFRSKAGISLPDGRYAQLLVPDHEAQETASFSLIGSSELDREREQPNGAWIIAHELAHQWWGNLVTCVTWQDFWLNEGFATFMVAAWKQQSLGNVAYEDELELARRRLARAREQGFDKPLAWGGRYPSLGVRRAIQYSKGALFLARLRKDLGEEAFWNGVREYTRRNAGKTVTSKDFQAAMERASGRNLSAIFDDWVFGSAGNHLVITTKSAMIPTSKMGG